MSRILLCLALAACVDPAVPLNVNTTQTCWDGTVCPTWEACPNYSTPGKCEVAEAPPPGWGGENVGAKVSDGGAK